MAVYLFISRIFGVILFFGGVIGIYKQVQRKKSGLNNKKKTSLVASLFFLFIGTPIVLTGLILIFCLIFNVPPESEILVKTMAPIIPLFEVAQMLSVPILLLAVLVSFINNYQLLKSGATK